MKIYSFPKDKKKFALCTIGKLENLYARDFALYYLELGVDKIYIYDNKSLLNNQNNKNKAKSVKMTKMIKKRKLIKKINTYL